MRKVAIPLVLFLALAGVVGFLATGGFIGSDVGAGGGGGGRGEAGRCRRYLRTGGGPRGG
ncbi:MAG: hypothetical protein ACT4PO_09750 [Actinomycetota bacterium]